MDQDIQVLINQLKRVREELPAALAETATSMSMTAKAISERTIKDKGFGAQYSYAEYPVWFLKGKQLNAKGLKYIQQKEREADKNDEFATGNWREFREAQGLQTKHVDLTYSGKMWAGMFPQEVQISGYKYIAPLGNNTQEGQDKMNWNFERYGDFIGETLTGENLDILYRVAIDELIRFLDARIDWQKT